MNKEHLKNQLSSFSSSMFKKDFFGIYHGSISAKAGSNHFIINTREAVFDRIDENALIKLSFTKDYRWKQASIDADIHHAIYSHISEAKFICFSAPQYITAYASEHNIIIPKDYFGSKELGSIEVYNPKQFESWYERAPSEISHYFQTNKTDLIIIRDYGVYIYNRDIYEMAKQLAILERSCRLLMLEKNSSALDD